MNLENILTICKNKKPYINGWKRMKRASVIIPLIEINGEISVLFEVRSRKLLSQPGDVCFPGGKIDKDETPMQAALRELEEELGIKESKITIISEQDTIVRIDNLIIHPFLGEVCCIEDIEINSNEVECIFTVPLSFLLKYEPLIVENDVKIERSDDFPYELIENGKNYNFKTGKTRSIFYQYNNYVIWGITAEILFNFLNLLKSNRFNE